MVPSAKAETLVTDSFRHQTLMASPARQRLAIQRLKHRIHYLQNQGDVHNLYVRGLTPSSDGEQVLLALGQLKTLQQTINRLSQNEFEKMAEHSQCRVYLERDQQGYELIFQHVEDLLESDDSFEARSSVGRFWNKNLISEREDFPNASITRSLFVIEFLSHILSSHGSYFIRQKERDVFGKSSACDFSSREQLELAFSQRLQLLNHLKLLVVGYRGVWDVMNLTSQLGFSDEYVRANRARQNWSLAEATFLGLSGALMILSGGVIALPPALLAVVTTTSSVTNKIGILYGLYLGADMGLNIYENMGEVGENYITSDGVETLNQAVLDIHDLPENPVDLAQTIYNFEISLHQFNLQISPSRLTEK
ncbi:MAG: hypothetical protein AAF203_10910, partial [Pseudomonadota bacterium]